MTGVECESTWSARGHRPHDGRHGEPGGGHGHPPLPQELRERDQGPPIVDEIYPQWMRSILLVRTYASRVHRHSGIFKKLPAIEEGRCSTLHCKKSKDDMPQEIRSIELACLKFIKRFIV